MKIKHISAAMLLATSATLQAQDTYLNDRVTAVDELNGTARYVGMGGALGALGADLSVISSNPAGIALYRKSDIGMTFGAVMPNGNGWDKNAPTTYGEGLARGTFDQMGVVWAWNCGSGSKLSFVNFAFNYQKKKNYNNGFFADNDNLGGVSQMDQLAELVTEGYNTNSNLAGLALEPVVGQEDSFFEQDEEGYYNPCPSYSNKYTRHQRGSLQAYDFNVSFNINERAYVGVTIGADNVNYKSWSEYGEWGADGANNSLLYNEREISGYGLNVKLGMIVRPIEESPFRIGLTMETPTWYRLRNSTFFDLGYAYEDGSLFKCDPPVDNYLEYTVRTPWKGRLSLGTTIGTQVAIGAEYEFANYGKTSMGYPLYGLNDTYHSDFNSEKDFAMNQHTRNTLRGQHTYKVGVEYKPVKDWALRLGYNYVSTRYKSTASFDQFSIDSKAMNYASSTDYMPLGAANIVTVGTGYKYKKFYVDLAYQIRAQHGDFYAFDTTGMDAELTPVDVNLTRQQLVLGLGFKF